MNYCMKEILKYKGFTGIFEYSNEDNVFYGNLDKINDLVIFEADNYRDVKKSFEEAVDNYIEFCNKINKKII